MRVVFAGGGTGGHLYPGLAIARAVRKLRPDIEPFFVGAQRGIEREVLPGTEFPHLLLDLHPLYRSRVWNNWRTLVGLTTAWRALGRSFREQRPALVVGTGGYAAVAALAYGVAHRIPIVEQTGDRIPSLTARMFSRWAREVYLSFPESADRFTVRSPDVLVDTGAPIDPPPPPASRPSPEAARAFWKFPPTAKVLLVSGGSQGALAINTAVGEMITEGLPDGVHVILATGKGTYDRFAGLESDRVRVRPYLSPIGDAYAATDLAVTRAGTMTLAELMAWHIPAILVPLPTAAADHQTHNARTLEEAGAAIHLPQSRLSGASLKDAITSVLKDPERQRALSRVATTRARPDAAAAIALRIVALIDSTGSTRSKER